MNQYLPVVNCYPFFLILRITGDWLPEAVGRWCHVVSLSGLRVFVVSKVSAQRVPRDGCNVGCDTRAWGEMRGLRDDESSMFLMSQVVIDRERLCVQLEPIPRVHERWLRYRVWPTLPRWG